MSSRNPFCFYFLTYFVHLVIIIISRARFIIADSSNIAPANLTTLRLVQIISRHGDRAPLQPYPNDIYKNASVYSINGWGELTETGAKQVYELGAYLRQRYDGFLPRTYQKRDFLILSSDVDRAIMSAESNLAGLYEVGLLPSSDIFKGWQPVPIHTIPKDEDNLIYRKANCPRYDSLVKDAHKTTEYTNILTENKEFLDFVAEMVGVNGTEYEKFKQILDAQDALRCQHWHNLTLPSWVNSTLYEKLDRFISLSFAWDVKTDEMKRLKIGPLLGRLVSEMRANVEAANLILTDTDSSEEEATDEYMKKPISSRKMYIYSAHDTTISAVLESLNLFSPQLIPPYASALIIELHRLPGTGNHFIEIFYKNETSREPYKLDLSRFCYDGDDVSSYHICSFDKFSTLLQKYIPSDWRSECQVENLLQMSPTTIKKSGDIERAWNGQNEAKSPGLMSFVLVLLAIMISLLVSAIILYFLFTNKAVVSKRQVNLMY